MSRRFFGIEKHLFFTIEYRWKEHNLPDTKLEPAVHGWWALAGFCAHQGAYKITLELEMLDELNP